MSDDAAFNAALGIDVAGFEEGWLTDLGVGEPVPYGPRPAPPGPLAPDWAAAPITSGAPGASGVPAPTFRNAPSGTDDISGPITIGVLAALAVLLTVGLFIVARGLSRGQPLLAPLAPIAEDGDGPEDEAVATSDSKLPDELTPTDDLDR